MDINVTGVWEHNITGQGVTVVVVDDGVEHTHKDIQLNYVSRNLVLIVDHILWAKLLALSSKSKFWRKAWGFISM